VALALAAAGVASSAVPAAAHGGDASKIHSCVQSSGVLQIVGANDTCGKNRALDWPAVDTNTTYGAGSGLALSSANVFSVTGAPWSGLTGVPAGFADGVDNVGGAATWSDLTGVPAGFADGVDNAGSMQWGDLTGVPSGFADGVDNAGSMQWGDLTGVPADLLDGDDDGSAAVTALKSQLAADDATPNESGDLVSFTKLKDLTSAAGGRILGSFIQDGTIQGQDVADGAITSNKLAGGYVGSTEAPLGAVTSEKIRDGAIQGRDLGSVLVAATQSVDPPSIPAGGQRAAVTVAIAGVKTGDLVTVSPPQFLEDNLVFAGSDVLTDGVVTIYLHNMSATPFDGAPHTWTIRYLNTND
jgi:hypothetical protein